MSKSLFVCLGAVVAMGVVTGSGQVNTTEGANVPGHGRVNAVNKQEVKAEKMIADGVQAGQLTANQADSFKRRLSQIQSDKTRAMTQRHGHLTKGEMKDLKGQEEELERDIQAALKKS